jgi:hypothetical protein
MKLPRLLLPALVALLPAALFAAEFPAAPHAEAASHSANRLWVQVALPKATQPTWVGDDMALQFAGLVVQTLQAQGYQGAVDTLEPEAAAPARAPVLVIRLNEWKAEPGSASCVFAASLRTPGSDRDLGGFVGDNLIVTADGTQKISSVGLKDSATEAMNNLYSRMQATGLVK